MNKCIYWLCVLVVVGCSVQRKSASTPKQAGEPWLDSLLQNKQLQGAHVGILIQAEDAATPLLQHQANQYFIPASNTKLYTCYAALKNLPDSIIAAYTVETADTLYIQWNADATTAVEDFKRHPLLEKAKASNKPIVLVHNNFTANHWGMGWAWDDYEADYMAERSEAPLFYNAATVTLQNGSLKALPPVINFDNSIAPNAKGFELRRQIQSNSFTILPGKETEITTTLATYWNQPQAQEKLVIDLLEAATGKRAVGWGKLPTAEVVKPLHSQPLDSVLKIMMHRSDNFFAEQLLIQVGGVVNQELNDRKAINTVLNKQLNTLPQKPKWVDGSGLSRYNLFTPATTVSLLKQMKNEISWQRLTTILPTGGKGTLGSYYKNYAGKIFAKTGTLSNNVSLSGYIQAKSGTWCMFSVMVNNHMGNVTDIRRAVEKMLVQVAEAN
ncbi:MAG: D-alanyl-D-alanine carboxypeptidase/D-alanyl-D-alanine-endopeptidase [Bacteroidetes bacterium]|nr:MAG: D-alanyl-D-alanine carboxypeptidase/D-alanyl-D-alanine-endopeptidase [Bacteroidota bacterium]